MEFCHFFLFVTFVVLTVDQFVERADGPHELQKQDSRIASWLHSFIPDNVQNPLDASICRNFLEAAKRSKTRPIVKKLPVSPDVIRKIVNKFASPNANLKDLRIACLCSLGFKGFFRYNELSNILPVHLEFQTDFVRIFVSQAKKDIYKEGNYVYIKKLNNQFCPVELLQRYIFEAGIDLNSSLALLRPE